MFLLRCNVHRCFQLCRQGGCGCLTPLQPPASWSWWRYRLCFVNLIKLILCTSDNLPSSNCRNCPICIFKKCRFDWNRPNWLAECNRNSFVGLDRCRWWEAGGDVAHENMVIASVVTKLWHARRQNGGSVPHKNSERLWMLKSCVQNDIRSKFETIIFKVYFVTDLYSVPKLASAGNSISTSQTKDPCAFVRKKNYILHVKGGGALIYSNIKS